MSRGWKAVLLWGLFLAVLGVLHLAFDIRDLQLGLALGAAAAVLLLGTLLALGPAQPAVRLLPETSYATVMVAVGIVMVVMGLVFGKWLWMIGAGVLVLGLGGVARELLAQRRSVS